MAIGLQRVGELLVFRVRLHFVEFVLFGPRGDILSELQAVGLLILLGKPLCI